MQQRQQILLVLILILLAVGGAYWLGSRKTTMDGASSSQITVVTTTYSLSYFVGRLISPSFKQIALLPKGVEAHEFVPRPSDLVKAQSARLMVMNGAGFDTWAANIASSVGLSAEQIFIAADDVDLQVLSSDAGANVPDPHFWLDPVAAKAIVQALSQRLLALAPSSERGIITQHEQALLSDLADLDRSYKQGLASCQNRTIVAAHDAYGYLARRYDINLIAVSGISPQDQPSARKLAQITELAKQQQAEYLFFEDQTNPALTNALAEEVGAQTLFLHPIENLSADQAQNGDDYLSLMNENLSHLRTAMKCQ